VRSFISNYIELSLSCPLFCQKGVKNRTNLYILDSTYGSLCMLTLALRHLRQISLLNNTIDHYFYFLLKKYF